MAERVGMKAIVQDSYGEAEDVMRLAEIDRPEIGDREVLLRVRAAGVDRGVWHLMAGLPYLLRVIGYGGLRAPRTRVRGSDVAGCVEAVGADVAGLRPGDEVYGVADGAFAEYAVAAADKLAPRPGNLTAAQAAASRSRASPPCRQCATAGKCSRDRRYWSSARPGASGRSPCRSPRRTGR
jgi:NADPH:quinone reductase-like Zn-dependent oxidoreductase